MASPSAKRRLRAQIATPSRAVTFAVACECGEVRSGARTFAFQVLPCPACGRKVLVFPASRLTESALPDVSDAHAAVPHAAWDWRKPLLVAAGSALILTATVVAVVFWGGGPRGEQTAEKSPPEQARLLLRSAEDLLRDGDVNQARATLEAGVAVVAREPGALPAPDARRLRRLLAQSAAVCDLTFESIPEMLHPLAGVPDRVWEQQFRDRYAGKSLMFDAVMHRNAAGQYAFDYELATPEGPVQVRWEQLRLLQNLPLHEPHRVLFAVRVAGVRRDAGGRWVIELAPDGLTLITDPDVLRGTSLPPPDDELRDVMTRQSRWLDELNQ